MRQYRDSGPQQQLTVEFEILGIKRSHHGLVFGVVLCADQVVNGVLG